MKCVSILTVFLWFTGKSQTAHNCIPIIVSDSLFNSPITINYAYFEKNGNIGQHKNKNNISNADNVFSVQNNCLSVVISTSKADNGIQQFILVTDAKQYSFNNTQCYWVKLIVTNNNDAKSIKINPLKFDLSVFPSKKSGVNFLKFNDIDPLIKMN